MYEYLVPTLKYFKYDGFYNSTGKSSLLIFNLGVEDRSTCRVQKYDKDRTNGVVRLLLLVRYVAHGIVPVVHVVFY